MQMKNSRLKKKFEVPKTISFCALLIEKTRYFLTYGKISYGQLYTFNKFLSFGTRTFPEILLQRNVRWVWDSQPQLVILEEFALTFMLSVPAIFQIRLVQTAAFL